MSSGYSYGYGESCSVRTLALGGCNSAGLTGYKMEKLLHRVWIFNENNL